MFHRKDLERYNKNKWLYIKSFELVYMFKYSSIYTHYVYVYKECI